MDRQNRYGVKKQVFLVVPAVLVVLLLLFLGMVGGRTEAGSAAAPSLANAAITPPLPTSYITVTPNCGGGAQVQFTVSGANWLASEPVALFWDGVLQSTLPAGHGPAFEQQWTMVGVADGAHTITAVSNSRVFRVTFTVPCAGDAGAFLPLVSSAGDSNSSAAELVLTADCNATPIPQLVLSGSNWPADEEIALFGEGLLRGLVGTGHGGSFEQRWNIGSGPTNITVLAASANAAVVRAIDFPCELPPPTATAPPYP